MTKAVAAGGHDASHVHESQLGGRKQSLPVIRELELPDDWEMKPGRPPRSQCKTGPRPCPYVECRYHNWLVDAESRPGRRHHRAEGGAPLAEINPVTMTTCALDVAEKPGRPKLMPFDEIGELLGVTDERARQLNERAIAKLKRLGYTVEELFPEDHP